MSEQFKNPYEGMQDVSRVTTDVAKGDYYLIKQIRPTSGTITGVLGLLWQKLCNELRERNITDYTRVEEFELLVANSRLIGNDEYERLSNEAAQWSERQAATGHVAEGGPRSATRRTMPKTAKRNVGRRTPRLGRQDSTGPSQSSNVQQPSSSESGDREGGESSQGAERVE